jgi:hypothetical protein
MINRRKSPERKKKKIAFKKLRLDLKKQASKTEFEQKRKSEIEAASYCLERALDYESSNLPKIAAANYLLSAVCYDNAAQASVALTQPRAAFKYFIKASKYYARANELNKESQDQSRDESKLTQMAKQTKEMADLCVYESARRFLRNYRATIGLHARIDRLK